MRLLPPISAEPAKPKHGRRRCTNEFEVVGDEGRLTMRRKSDGVVEGVARFDASDLATVRRFYWSAHPHGYPAASAAGSRCILMHWMLVGRGYDHIDRDGMNNRRSNFRPATKAENCRNRGRGSNNRGRYKGVSYYASHGRWVARINSGGRSRYLGIFDTDTEAARAYDAAARESYGAFAYLNFN
jgi:hypothetical protein